MPLDRHCRQDGWWLQLGRLLVTYLCSAATHSQCLLDNCVGAIDSAFSSSSTFCSHLPCRAGESHQQAA